MSLFNLFGDSEKKKQPTKSEAPSHWVKCTSCQSLMYYKEMEKQNHVCPKCGFHLRIGVQERLAIIADEGSFVEFDASLKPIDPLKFVDKKSYAARIEEAYAKNGRYSSVVSGECTINSVPVQLVVFDFNFMGGSLGSVEGEKIVRAINRALEKRQGVIIVSASGGARMQESTFSLLQMSKTSAALARLAQANLPYISLLTDPTMGGVSASFATLGDIIIAEPGALVGFAGQRVIKQTIGSDLPDGFQRAEFLLEKGSIDMIVGRNELKDTLSDLLTLLLP
ncbi:MAG TPA: acetyl-CoA carboxylase, carboxyltransferase subunit beta [Sulfuricurvum sp.]|nr:MAG: acetyl-CoA carboxylase carboxyl transferase subunit beta [Campylobacterales bacterium 16-40-21]OZA03709.1 MAG: acetyl-CoA carboxylase carboxyl transferase subunit beta [Sulfuricurvum sp. 17-40-25]HQS65775.1 acetyl-CoA carboxylase, carboxyltransferase subunit beta [Sulfuricurvum sp.]HQT37146.1 acetyl-CoA carboxylase, carboxyltransferase subunit beta [Sulfuricurvum sp.]